MALLKIVGHGETSTVVVGWKEMKINVIVRPGKKKKLFSVHPSQFFQVGRAVFFFFFFFLQ